MSFEEDTDITDAPFRLYSIKLYHIAQIQIKHRRVSSLVTMTVGIFGFVLNLCRPRDIIETNKLF
jgi:hypothetical protein